MGRPKGGRRGDPRAAAGRREHLSATHGWEALTVRRIAEAAGTRTRAVYALFDSKEGLGRRCTRPCSRVCATFCKRASPPTTHAATSPCSRSHIASGPWSARSATPWRCTASSASDSRPRSDEGLAVSREALGELRQAVQRCHDAGLLLGDRDPEDVVTRMRPWSTAWPSSRTSGCSAPTRRPSGLAAVAAQLDGYVRPTPPRRERGARRRAQRYGA